MKKQPDSLEITFITNTIGFTRLSHQLSEMLDRHN